MTVKLAFALDVPGLDEAKRWVSDLKDHVDVFKVGLELFVSAGPAATEAVVSSGKPCFLDLKLNDISETVARAASRVRELGVRYLTVHASAGETALKRCAELQNDSFSVLAVTVLTSFDSMTLKSLGIEEPPLSHAVRLATLAHDAGTYGLICSPLELSNLRTVFGRDLVLVTPGIRPAQKQPTLSGTSDDQKRVATPKAAKQAGANMIVVGRPIRDAKDPVAMAQAIRGELHG